MSVYREPEDPRPFIKKVIQFPKMPNIRNPVLRIIYGILTPIFIPIVWDHTNGAITFGLIVSLLLSAIVALHSASEDRHTWDK